VSPTVELIPINESHINFWHEITNEPEATEHQPLTPRTTEELQLQLIKYSQPDLANSNYHMYKWVVAEKRSGHKVGVVSFNKTDIEHKIGRIGYTI
jgi:RimJ/RimL family protein N-acetyltransferase|tara:strand:- start:42803 stop:43090 length:288 start_codon:yes stop_codon:yes gene_type:complete